MGKLKNILKDIIFFTSNNSWILTVLLIPLIKYLYKRTKNRLTKKEQELLKEIRNSENKKIVFVKFDNTPPFSNYKTNIPHNELVEVLESLVNKDLLNKIESEKSIKYSLNN